MLSMLPFFGKFSYPVRKRLNHVKLSAHKTLGSSVGLSLASKGSHSP
jgi:hypothetical protein